MHRYEKSSKLLEQMNEYHDRLKKRYNDYKIVESKMLNFVRWLFFKLCPNNINVNESIEANLIVEFASKNIYYSILRFLIQIGYHSFNFDNRLWLIDKKPPIQKWINLTIDQHLNNTNQ